MYTSLNLIECPESALSNLPENMEVRGDLIFPANDESLKSLPKGLKVGEGLYLGGCISLESLPKGLKVGGELDLDSCYSLKSLPEDLKVGGKIWINPNDDEGTGVRKKDFPIHLRSKVKVKRKNS